MVQLSMMSSQIAGGPAPLLHRQGPEIHSSIKVKCNSSVLLTGNPPLHMITQENKESLLFKAFVSVLPKILHNKDCFTNILKLEIIFMYIKTPCCMS